MSSHRLEKVTKEIVRSVSEILRTEIRDPGLGMVTVTRVKLSRDYKYACVYFSILGSGKSRKKSLLALERARKFVQFHLGKRLQLRQVPALTFEFDESIAGSIRISKLIDKAIAKGEVPPDAGEGTEAQPAGAGEDAGAQATDAAGEGAGAEEDDEAEGDQAEGGQDAVEDGEDDAEGEDDDAGDADDDADDAKNTKNE